VVGRLDCTSDKACESGFLPPSLGEGGASDPDDELRGLLSDIVSTKLPRRLHIKGEPKSSFSLFVEITWGAVSASGLACFGW
jgi:hypothetical protein